MKKQQNTKGQTKQKFNYELDQKVFVHTIKQDGIISSINREKEIAIVEVVTNDTKKKERVEVKFANISPYREKEPKKYNPNEMYWMVKDFHKAFSHPIADKPQSLELNRAINRSTWTGEEALVEFIHQSSSNKNEFLQAYDRLIQGLEKAKQKSLGLEYPKNELEKIVGQSDALTDAMYFILGSFVELGVKPFNLFKIVQESNMSKLFKDGNGKLYPKYREDGKILKSEHFVEPEPRLHKEIERQMNRK